MANMTHDYRRVVLAHAVRDLSEAARRERSTLPMAAPERQFYLGVEAAAEEVLRPELGAARPAGWPAAETQAFQEGYLRAIDLLAVARNAADPPQRLPLPQR